MYKNLKQFIASVNGANFRKENSVRISIDEANDIVHELTRLLLEKDEVAKDKGEVIVDGGQFRQ